MILLDPGRESYPSLDPSARRIMRATSDFFENMGKKRLKESYHGMTWYADFIEFIGKEQMFATLLTPYAYGEGDPLTRWDTHRICAANELLAFYGLPYWYAWQVSILGLGPIWMSKNEAAKEKAAQLLRQGNIFAFGLSEKAHGADLYKSDMRLTPVDENRYFADGGKYYIGNGNLAAMVSTFGKNSDTGEYVFFAVDSQHPRYECIQNVVAWPGYVAEFALNGYPITEADILSVGQDAWDAALNTVNVGKFNLGWASIGICTHAMYEALSHAAHRNLYGRWVTDFPHVRRLFIESYGRLVAMKLFALRASDYMRAATADDRRYLLYNPLVKMKVTTEGERVINLLWDVISARGFEKDTYFEMAASEIRALPKLEGTVHVNMALVVKFMANYFFNPAEYPQVGRQCQPADDIFLFNQGSTRGLGKIRFHDFRAVYAAFDTPNIHRFKEQIAKMEEMLQQAPPDENQARDIDFLLSLGELFTLVVYGQLILEIAHLEKTDQRLLDVIFSILVQDFSNYAMALYHHRQSTQTQMDYCMAMIRKPSVENDAAIWKEQVSVLVDAYQMAP